MRDYKFRGIVKEKGMEKSFIEGSLVHITRTYKGEEGECECDIYQIINEDGVGFFVDKNTVGQFTGLHDKNGKEIYEGDIVKYADLFKYIVCFGEYNINPENCAESIIVGFYLKGIKSKLMQEEMIEELYSINGIASKFPKHCVDDETSKEAVDNLELNVIGNIYENSDILKGADNIE